MWCIAWWHSGRDDEDEDEEFVGLESSRTGPGYEEVLTPLSVETSLPSTVSRCTSLSAMQVTGIGRTRDSDKMMLHEYKWPARSADVSTSKTTPIDNVRNVARFISNGGTLTALLLTLTFPLPHSAVAERFFSLSF